MRSPFIHYKLVPVLIPFTFLFIYVRYLMYSGSYWFWSWDIRSPHFGLYTRFESVPGWPFISRQNQELILPLIISLIVMKIYLWVLKRKNKPKE